MTIASLRKRIDKKDRAILTLLRKRFVLCKKTTDLKENVEDTNREAELKELWKKEARALGLREEFALSLLEEILSESKRLQRS